jgi:hypothetical protein
MNNAPDTIADPIASKEAQVERLRRDLEIAEAELRGMKLMRDQFLIPHKPAHVPPVVAGRFSISGSASGGKIASTSGYRGGRQPGAISNTWKAILADAWRTRGGKGFMEGNLVALAETYGVNLKPSDARNRLVSYAAHNYVEENPDYPGMWRVTVHAAQKFGFDKEPLKDEAPSTSAAEPHESLAQGDQTGAD